MVQGKRGADNGFKQSHRLYYRVQAEDVEGERLIAARIPYANTARTEDTPHYQQFYAN
jgi:hypothetical protein